MKGVSLQYLMEQKIGNPRWQKWMEKQVGYNFEIKNKRGLENLSANDLSRREKAQSSQVVCFSSYNHRDVEKTRCVSFQVSTSCTFTSLGLCLCETSYAMGVAYHLGIS